MNKIFYHKGDAVHEFLTSNRYQAFMHGSNCQATMNSGIARDVKSRIPELYHADLDMHLTTKPVNKLGKYSYVTYKSEESSSPHKMAFNLYTQLYYGREKRHFNYGAFMESILGAVKEAQRHGCVDTNNSLYDMINIIIPKIGCGLGGGDWSIVEEIITRLQFDDINVVFHVLVLD